MQGRRIDPLLSVVDMEPGDYGRRGGDWWLCIPTGEFVMLDDRWATVEHDDGTVTVSPSLDVHGQRPWHGFLERGVWRSV